MGYEANRDKCNKGKEIKDLSVLVVIAAIIFVLACVFDIFEIIVEWTQAYETWQVDEFITLALVLVFALCIFSVRRCKELGREVTQRKKAEYAVEKLNKELESTVQELSRTNKELQDFIHIASHDLKTPLRGIGTLADWIATDYAEKFDEQGKEQVKLLTTRAEWTIRLIDSMLEYSDITRNRRNEKTVDLNTLLTEVIREISPPENIEMTIENQFPILLCEKAHLMQVFQNLLSNAIKYIDKPQGRVRIGCVEENGFWKFSVADNGPGIERPYFEKIFQILQTLSHRDEFESTGIGLTTAKKIVELYGGRIWLESKVGEGSTFFFTLPKPIDTGV